MTAGNMAHVVQVRSPPSWITLLRNTLILLPALGVLVGGHPPSQPTSKQEQLPPYFSVNDALQAAWQDLQGLPAADHPFIRYLWMPQGLPHQRKVLSLTINIVSRASVLRRPTICAQGHLARIDLRHYAPREKDLKDWLRIWEDFQFDPWLSLFITKDTLGRLQALGQNVDDLFTLEGAVHGIKGHACAPQEKNDKQEIVVIRLDLPYVDGRTLARLRAATLSQAPLVSAVYFQLRALTTIKDKGLYAVLWGGRYYDLVGIQKAEELYDYAEENNVTDQDVFFEKLGLGNVVKKLRAEDILNEQRSDQRVVLLRSNVTGKPRRADFFHTLAARDTLSWGSITHDLRDQDIDINGHPLLNLLQAQDQAREAIFDRANGTHIYALFDGQGKLLDEATIEVVADHTIPAPHTPRLQCALSCIACHETDGSDGWKAIPNELATLVHGQKGSIDILTDVSNLKASLSDTLDRLAGLYAGSIDRSLERARDDYARTVLLATGPWPEAGDQTKVVAHATSALVREVRQYQYGQIGAEQALKELGIQVSAEEALPTFRKLLRPDMRARFGNVVWEDPRIAALREGLQLSRSDWSLIYGFVWERAHAAQKTE
jgi:hypothetical protein